MPIAEQQATYMIDNYLLNPLKMYGEIPFPSVAYDEEAYTESDWWRGPTWLAPAFLLLEVLKKYGYTTAYYATMQQLYNMIIEDGRLSELFNSQTGQGLGNEQQGWTAAILLYFNACLGKNMQNR
ncbi:MAG: hypothetical protein HC896_15460 [Bacteroidales bacterium]|nr:hypothetical protein [Bacteroidales bacterium]